MENDYKEEPTRNDFCDGCSSLPFVSRWCLISSLWLDVLRRLRVSTLGLKMSYTLPELDSSESAPLLRSSNAFHFVSCIADGN